MKGNVYFTLEHGGSIAVEVADVDPADSIVPAGLASEMTERVNETLESALEKIRPAANAIISALRHLPDSAEEIGVEFGVKLTAKAGVVLASADAEATYKVTLKWKGNKS